MTGSRIVRSYTQHIGSPPAAVFQLLCPVREAQWAHGWAEHCTLVHSISGFAETGCVFQTRGDGVPDTTWVITRHDPPADGCPGTIQFARVCPGLEAVLLAITVEGEGASSLVAITYTVVPLPGADPALVAARWTPEVFEADLAWWESSMNHFLATGKILEPETR